MYKTKAKSKIKSRLWKILTKELVHKRMVQKLLSVGVSVSLMVAMVPLGGQTFVAEAATPTIPDTMFITKGALLDLCETTNVTTTDGGEKKPTGLLASADKANNKEININFGTRPDAVKYYNDSNFSNAVTAAAGPMTWRVAGSETIDGKAGLVLYSKEPMISATALDASSNSIFQVDQNDKQFTPESNVGYGDRTQKDVYANHWGASNIRTQLKNLVGTYFSSGEQGILEDSTVKTTDTRNSVDYETKDKLYAARLKASTYNYPNNTQITVGEFDNLMIDKAY